MKGSILNIIKNFAQHLFRDPNFFKPFEELGYNIKTWYSFWNRSDAGIFKGIEVPVNLVGQIEQV